MTKTTLRQDDREAIRDALIAHKFAPIDAELLALENTLAEEVRAFVHGDYLKTMERAPKGAFRQSNNIRIAIDGKQLSLAYGGKYPNAVYRREFYDFEGKFTSAEPLMARVLEWAGCVQDAKKEREALTSRTLGTLTEAWPDAERFITEQWRNRAGRTERQLPVALGKLSETLADALAKLAAFGAEQLNEWEDATILAAQKAQAVGDADDLHDARTRQLAHQAAAANRRLALELQAIRSPK